MLVGKQLKKSFAVNWYGRTRIDFEPCWEFSIGLMLEG